jgi:hypothetical protein
MNLSIDIDPLFRYANTLEHMTIPAADEHAATVVWLHGAGLHSSKHANALNELECMCLLTYLNVWHWRVCVCVCECVYVCVCVCVCGYSGIMACIFNVFELRVYLSVEN